MIKKQIGWQLEKFEFSSSLETRAVYQQVRSQIESMLTNGWEVLGTKVLGYESTNGNAMVLVELAKYEWVPEPVTEVKAVKATKTKDA